jgi:pyridoxamine 5'-phosphate oxidase
MPQADPLVRFEEWLAEATRSEPVDPTAAALATATPEGAPSVRMVLVRGHDGRGFVFYTNLGSRKAIELDANPRAALCLHWKSLERQVRIEGPVEPVSAAEADAYFSSRPRDSRIGAWASRQSQPLTGRFELERRVAETVLRFPLGEVPRPPFWSGYRLRPERMEFWWQRPFRLHERTLYLREGEGEGWRSELLYP